MDVVRRHVRAHRQASTPFRPSRSQVLAISVGTGPFPLPSRVLSGRNRTTGRNDRLVLWRHDRGYVAMAISRCSVHILDLRLCVLGWRCNLDDAVKGRTHRTWSYL
jgi:hypothetical protein